jgi:hypothetical protein
MAVGYDDVGFVGNRFSQHGGRVIASSPSDEADARLPEALSAPA